MTFATYSFNADVRPARRSIRTSSRRRRRRRARCRAFSTSRPISSGRKSTWRTSPSSTRSPEDLTVSASYLFSRGTHLPTFIDTQPAGAELPGDVRAGRTRTSARSRSTAAPRPDTRIGSRDRGARRRRLAVSRTRAAGEHAASANGLLFNVNYTLSKADGHGPELDDVHLELLDRRRSERPGR